MVFKVIESDITKSGQALSIFGKQLRNVYRDMSSAISTIRTNGLTRENLSQLAPSRILGNTLSQQDVQALRDYNNVLRNGITYTNEFGETVNRSVSANTAFYRCLGNSSSAAQELARNANGAAVSEEALRTATNNLTFAQKAANAATKALVVGLNLIGNIAFAIAINFIITKITEAVNKEKELRQSISETAEETKRQTDSLNSLIKSYEEFADKTEYTVEEKERLKDIQDQLAESYHNEVSDIDLVNGKYDEQIAKLKELRQEKLKNTQASLTAERTYAKKDTENVKGNDLNTKIKFQESDFTLDTDAYKEMVAKIEKATNHGDGTGAFYTGLFGETLKFSGTADQRVKDIKAVMGILEQYGYTATETYAELSNLYDKTYELIDAEDKATYNLADNMLQQYLLTDNGNIDKVNEKGKEAYLSWRDGLLQQAKGDSELQSALSSLAEKQFPDYANYFNNLTKAKSMFVKGKINSKPISDFLEEKLTPEELDIAMQIPDLFDEGLEGATKKIREWEKNNPITLTVAFDNEEFDEKIEEATKSVSAFTSSQKDLNSALEEQKEHGQLSASTMQSLIDAGYSEALTINKVTGAVTLNTEKYKELNNEKKKEIQLEIAKLKVDLINPYKEETTAIADLERSLSSLNEEERKATQIKIANMRANLANSNLTDEQIKQKEQQLADLEAMLVSLDAPEFDNDNSNGNTDPNKDAFDKLYSKWQHDLEMNRVTQEEYINWLDGAYKQYFSDLTKYQDEYNKYEAEVYNARKDREQDLFDKKIENYKKLSDNALNDKITDFGVSNEDVKNLEEFNKEMQKTWGLGNVDLTKRPKVAMDDGSTATVLSSTEFVWQGDDENGQYVAIHYTPILPDGTVLDDKSLEDYLYNTLEGSEDILKADNLGIVLKVDSNLSASEQEIKDLLNGNGISDNVQKILDDIEKWDNGLHEVQEQWVELDDKAKSSDSATTYANKWDYARSQINSAITETQNRINELSLKKGFEDEIEELTSDLEGLYDTLDDINKQEIESQTEYIETLKDEYSDLMDEQIDQQKKLSEEIEKSYENRISAIDKQIDALKKVSEAEERQKSILEAEKDVKEAILELDKAKTKKRLVYSGDGSWHLKEDKSAVDEAKKNLEDKQESLNEAKQDEQIAKLEEQKELLETQKDNSKEYYDKAVEDLESQKESREKQYDILVDIYEQLGGEKRQTSLNDSLVEKLTSNGNINKAVQGLTPTEMKQAITSGILTTDNNGNYAIDYSILGKNEQAVKENTAELEKLNNQLSGKSDTVNSNTPTYNNKNLDAEGYLIGADGKRVLHDGKPIHAKNFSDEIAKRNTSKKMTDVVKGVGKFAGYDTMQDLIEAMITGEYTVPKAQLSNFMGATISPKISQNMPRIGEYMTNAVNNTAPSINFTVNVDGSADEKTIERMKTEISNTLVDYTNYMASSMSTAMFRQKNKS